MGQPKAAGFLEEGAVFGHYQIVRHLGSGGMGSVYQASHTKLGKRVAIKTLLPQYAANVEAQSRFLREGSLAAKLQHPHVVGVTDFGIEDGIAYLVMEFLEGRDLAAYLAGRQKLFADELADLMIPVVAALASAHDQGIVHRDLKPANIYLLTSKSGEPVPKVLDFGISKLLNDPEAAQLTGSLALLGTPSYMSPEQARSSKYIDARSDQYTLAVILYQCLTGRLPFVGDGIYDLIRLVVEGHFQPPSELVEGVPPELEQVVLRAMSNRPDDRFATTWEFGAALLPFASPRTQVMWERDFKAGVSAGGHSAGVVLPAPAPTPIALQLIQAPPGPQASLGTGSTSASQLPSSPFAQSLPEGRAPSISKPSHLPPGDASVSVPLESQQTRIGQSLGPDPARLAKLSPVPVEDEGGADLGSSPSQASDTSAEGSESESSISTDLDEAGIRPRRSPILFAVAIVVVLGLGAGAYYALGPDSGTSEGASLAVKKPASKPPAEVAPTAVRSPTVTETAPPAPTPAPAPVAAPAVAPVPVAPIPAPAPTPPTAVASTKAAPSAESHRHKKASSPAAAPPPAADCNPPYTVDAAGHHIPKEQCE